MPTQAELERERQSYAAGRDSAKKIKKAEASLYPNWMVVAEALSVAQHEAFRVTGSNNNQGKEYAQAFSRILARERLDEESFPKLDKKTRAACLEIVHYRGSIEEWRGRLSEGDKSRYNHPVTVLRNWKASFPKQRPSHPIPNYVTDGDDPTAVLDGGEAKPKKRKEDNATFEALHQELYETKLALASVQAECVRLQAANEALMAEIEALKK